MNNIVFILGMHRSGTSMVTGILNICGAWLGKNLLMGAKDNPKGHFENKDFMHLNVRLLKANGGRWFDPPGTVAFKGLKNHMKRFLLSLPDVPVIVLKDPRTIFTVHLWQTLIPEKQIKFVYIKRDYWAIAESLRKRNGFSIQKGLNLSGRYNNQIVSFLIRLDKSKYFECNYDDFFHKNKNELIYDLCEFAGLKKPGEKTMKKLDDFITPELRHWK